MHRYQPDSSGSPDVDDTLARHLQPDGGFVCVRCRQLAARHADKIVKNGAFEHVFENPYGLAFRIGCFSQATGCGAVGEHFEAFTWFPGFAWTMAVCTRCELHLGWRYAQEGDAFWGLILTRLVEIG